SGTTSNTWNIDTICAGVDIDSATRVVYLANPIKREIYSLNLDIGKWETFARIPESDSLGALLFDKRTRRIYVGDAGTGKIYLVETGSRSVRTLLRIRGVPSALALDEGRRKLYIADAANKKVWSADADRKSTPKDFVGTPELNNLSGLSMNPDGTLLLS